MWWNAIGLFGATKKDPAGSANGVAQAATDYGVSQMTRARFLNEKTQHPARYPWGHSDLIDPEVAIWATAASYRRAHEKHGAAMTYYQLGKWWAGAGPGANRKANDIAEHGRKVFDTDP